MKYFALVCLILSSYLWRNGRAQTQDSCVRAQTSCEDCIRLHPDCVWCADEPESNVSTPIRCVNRTTNPECQNRIDPRSNEEKIRNMNFSNESQSIESPDFVTVQPQATNLNLRIGEPLKFNITYRKLIEYPLDLYYLLDLSYSMRDDLQQLQNLGENLVDTIRANITNNANLGFGTFVDKVLLPYATNQSSVFNRICPGECQRPFGFRHQVTLTSNGTTFREAVTGTEISANLDTPEGGFDALMQIAVCTELIGWRKDALHVVLFTSDAPSHVALDGKLAGLFNKNDLTCSMEKEWSSDDYIYTKSKTQDYPSVGQLRKVFIENQIETIFAVTSDVYHLYEGLDRILPATIEILQSDSGNIIKVISDAYDTIRSQFRLNNPMQHVPDNVEFSFNVLCPGHSTWQRNVFQCNNVSVGDDVIFEFELTAKSCPSDPIKVDVIPLTFSAVPEDVNLTISYICECNCSNPSNRSRSACSNNGNLQCGVCECDSGKSGSVCQHTCETTKSSQELVLNCTDPNPLSRTQNGLCNGNGFCICGNCTTGCFSGFFGEYCECQRSGCRVDQNDQECGGQEKGTCSNCYGDRQCVCNEAEGWYLNTNTDICDCNDIECKAQTNDTQSCSGNGFCECNICVCYNNSMYWDGRYCDQCVHPSCSILYEGSNGNDDEDSIRARVCGNADIRACVECAYSVSGDCESLCQDMDINFRTLDTLPDCTACHQSVSTTDECQPCNNLNENLFPSLTCVIEREDDCPIDYLVGWNRDPPSVGVLVKRRNPLDDCTPTIDPLVIILPVTGTILLIGIISMISWKFVVDYRDRKAYNEYLIEKEMAKWSNNDNKIYQSATTKVENPIFID